VAIQERRLDCFLAVLLAMTVPGVASKFPSSRAVSTLSRSAAGL
jgi:hypothetical protein